MGLSFGLCINS